VHSSLSSYTVMTGPTAPFERTSISRLSQLHVSCKWQAVLRRPKSPVSVSDSAYDYTFIRLSSDTSVQPA